MSDDDSDSDYEPTAAGIEEAVETPHSLLQDIPRSRASKLDVLLSDMQREDTERVQHKKRAVMASTGRTEAANGEVGAMNGSRETKQKRKQRLLLESIFGRSQARDMVDADGDNKRSRIDNEDVRTFSREAAQKVQKSVKISEKVKFAGKEILIQKTTMSNAATVHVAAPVSALDKVIDELKGPKTIGTMTKTNVDWENYKEQEGLEDDLAEASKDGYLHRKDFLQRCDVRAFESERDKRLQQAAKNL